MFVVSSHLCSIFVTSIVRGSKIYENGDIYTVFHVVKIRKAHSGAVNAFKERTVFTSIFEIANCSFSIRLRFSAFIMKMTNFTRVCSGIYGFTISANIFRTSVDFL